MTPPPDARVDGAAILDRLHTALTRYVVLPTPEATDAVALWIAASHAQPAWAHAPRLVIRAPEKRCGKSRLLDVVEATCHSPLITVNASTAAVYRSIDEDPPTLLVDEADTIFGAARSGDAKEDLRGLLNAGHQRNRPAIRWDAANRSREVLPTFAMAALAGIGTMPDTIEDRSVIIRMRRRINGETVAPYRHRRDRPHLRTLAEELDGWLRPTLEILELAEPVMPVDDRAADTWEPLIAIADHAGRDWPERARHALITMIAEATADETPSLKVQLLIDVRSAFGSSTTALFTKQLLALLNADPEAPWADMGAGGLSARRLADLLHEHGIRSRNVRVPGEQGKGYERADFLDAWRRYCPPIDDPPTGPEDDPALPVGRIETSRRPAHTPAHQG
ncbi:DUF3631 domain-containing protein [Frankia sp. CiP3]|uniref:DUF3631 domain-containing protein n=1 Tax=Frankia sp. CiP3 TaxID=2880971 RepID=UPI001EF6D5BA|nr:DUF3631 domain-containing protein [Frankia sp. CiP3]